MKRFVLLGAVLILLLMAGCGGGSGGGALIGSLTMDAKLVDETGGWYHAEVTSVYKHPTKDSTGVELTFTIEARTRSGVLITAYSGAITKKQASGGITITWPSIQQGAEAITLDLTVSTGDLIKYQRLTIPAASAMSASPAFVNMSTGLSQLVTISGSRSPYIVYSSPAGVTATMSSSTELTISEAAFQRLNGAVLIQSSLGELVTISIRY